MSLKPSHYIDPDDAEADTLEPGWKNHTEDDNEQCKDQSGFGFTLKKHKLLEKATKDADQRITAANRLNEIQERLAAVEEQNSELRVMLQDITSADERLREYLCARRKEILGKIRNPLPLASTSASQSTEPQMQSGRTEDNDTSVTPSQGKQASTSISS
ncbi:hypothetical protein PtB15_1B732 [Puccinia triticina]|nr:hypothetical protein PtB15_1B732 [Puccinia triticina]